MADSDPRASRGETRPLWRIAEPTTTLTDLALALLTAALAVSLLRHGARAGEAGVVLWGTAFASTAASALLGGVVHGFAPWLAAGARAAVWKATLAGVGITNFLLVSAVAVAETGGAARTALLLFAGVKLVAYLARLAVRDDFAVAAIDSGVSLLVVLLLQLGGLLAGEGDARWIAAGVAVALAGAAVQRGGLSLHRHLNHNDLFHLVQMGAAYLLYRGGLLL